MDSTTITEGLDQLCLGEELTRAVATRLGAIPKILPLPTTDKVSSPAPARRTYTNSEHNDDKTGTEGGGLARPAAGGVRPSSSASRLVAPTTPAVLRKHQKKRNRKDRRREEEEQETGKNNPAPASRVERLRQEVQRSSSDVNIQNSRLPVTSPDDVTSMLFKSQSSVSLSTRVKNLPASFFADDLPEEKSETDVKEKKEGKKKRKGRKRKQDVKESNNENQKEKEGEDEEEEEDVGEEIITTVGDEQTVYNWRNVTKNGDIKKCILVEGSKDGGRPVQGEVVLVKSQGKLKDGTMIDDYPNLVFRVGEYEVIEGLDLVVQSMYKNELAIVSVKPSMAYGEVGRKPDVPPDSRITYLFGLLHFEKQKEMAEMTWAQRRKMGQSRMRIANWWYSRKEYPIAVKCYKKALQFYNNIPSNQECSTPEEYRELLTLMEERLRVMRQVANIFKRIANLIQSGHIET